jgi:hypothetical protein
MMPNYSAVTDATDHSLSATVDARYEPLVALSSADAVEGVELAMPFAGMRRRPGR